MSDEAQKKKSDLSSEAYQASLERHRKSIEKVKEVHKLPVYRNEPAVIKLFREVRSAELMPTPNDLRGLSKWEWITMPFDKLPPVRQM